MNLLINQKSTSKFRRFERYMKIIVVPDSFKDSLSAKDVAIHIETGIRKLIPEADISKIPISDGGEGLLDSLISFSGGQLIQEVVNDPLMRRTLSEFGILGDQKTAVIEMAKASGLELLKPEERNPMLTSTFGTGQLIKAALDRGCTKIIVGLGGSATNDGGTGMIKALGGKFLDKNGNEIPPQGGRLQELNHIDVSEIDSRLGACEFIAACDVTNPLTGTHGASLVFGKQKGGNKAQLAQLDQSLKKYAEIVQDQFHIDIDSPEGAGAAGGMGAAMLGFFNANLARGIDLIIEQLQLEDQIKNADLVFTGEGGIDKQTLFGKTIFGIARITKKHRIPLIAIAGTLGNDIEAIYDLGVTGVFSIIDKPMSLDEAKEQAPQLIESCVENILRTFIN
jgi:glycerate kinase